MPKAYSVKPLIRNDGSFYSATFKNASGERVTRGLGTNNRGTAGLICAGLVTLHEAGITSAADTPIDVSLEAARLYFGNLDHEEHAADIQMPLAAVQTQLENFPVSIRAKMLPVLLERDRLRKSNELQRLEIAGQKRTIALLKDELADLKRSVLGRAIEAGKNVPPLEAALKLFEATMKAETTDFNAGVVLSVVRRFCITLPPERKNAVEISADDIGRFLDAETAKGDENKRATRRDAIRRRLGRFINWSAKRWKYPSQMLDVRAIDRGALDREKGEIQYHALSEVEAAIAKLPNEYWKTLVATLAYAGLQLAELVWLRKSDVHIAPDGKSGKLLITTVDDGNGEKHLLKTDHRRREVNLHSTLLLPLIKNYLLSEYPGELFLFAIPKMDRCDDRERWLVNSLSTKLRGHVGGKRRKPTPALLPIGMNAKSLRRTFGSLLLRSGKTTVEVAAAMGNTPEVVTRNYARLRGHEVSVDF